MRTKITLTATVRREGLAKIVGDFVRNGLNFSASPSKVNSQEYTVIIISESNSNNLHNVLRW